MSQEITAKAKEFDDELEKFILKYADKLNHQEAEQAVAMMLARALSAYIATQQKHGRTKAQTAETLRQIVSRQWNNPKMPPRPFH